MPFNNRRNSRDDNSKKTEATPKASGQRVVVNNHHRKTDRISLVQIVRKGDLQKGRLIDSRRKIKKAPIAHTTGLKAMIGPLKNLKRTKSGKETALSGNMITATGKAVDVRLKEMIASGNLSVTPTASRSLAAHTRSTMKIKETAEVRHSIHGKRSPLLSLRTTD